MKGKKENLRKKKEIELIKRNTLINITKSWRNSEWKKFHQNHFSSFRINPLRSESILFTRITLIQFLFQDFGTHFKWDYYSWLVQLTFIKLIEKIKNLSIGKKLSRDWGNPNRTSIKKSLGPVGVFSQVSLSLFSSLDFLSLDCLSLSLNFFLSLDSLTQVIPSFLCKNSFELDQSWFKQDSFCWSCHP